METHRDDVRPCSFCGEPVDLGTAHFPHQPDGPNRIVGVHVDCDCDLVAHPQCCSECQAHGEFLGDAPRGPRAWVGRGPGQAVVAANEHGFDPDSDTCRCGGQVVYFEDGDDQHDVGEGCDVVGLTWRSLQLGRLDRPAEEAT